ncbi:hypothetical protein N7471_011916 [Penicillium samsonianum]|uniref:uncharacterized protein n=1 Tax=Penicillium samsonianum TaxID=1882272 RepID=UPI002549BA09|nr:uncharacterized protein N7471_011916 [Penicillium samsonianum]KAJ6124599.1 hypothetical protein N7471_011916 [Penicillium samsonianum]
MRFSILALATVIGLAIASPIEANKEASVVSRSNNCFTLCKIDGGSDQGCLEKCKNS